jgi:predicted metal-dependent hydrolase
MKYRILEESYEELYPEMELPKLKIEYSGRFRSYNAKIIRSGSNYELKLSNKWKNISEHIQKGLIQKLILKINNDNKNTLSIELYNKFISKIGKYSERIDSDPLLKTLFDELNEYYFMGLMEQPNLKFGGRNLRKLGSYSYEEDLVTISSILKEEYQLLKYVVYHELLHKKHGIKKGKKRNMYHSKKFREEEKKFEDQKIEKKLKKYLKRKSFFNIFSMN